MSDIALQPGAAKPVINDAAEDLMARAEAEPQSEEAIRERKT